MKFTYTYNMHKINNNNAKYALVHISRDPTINPLLHFPLLLHNIIVYYIQYTCVYTVYMRIYSIHAYT